MNDETRTRELAPLVAGGGRPLAIIPQNVEQAYRQAQFAVAGKFAPQGWTVEMAVSAIMMGAECGMRPMMSMQRICVINGRPSVWGDAVLGIAMATGQLEDWSERIEGMGDDRVAICTVRRRGIPTPVVKTFSVAMAKEAGLWGKAGPWRSFPERMLAMRARVAFRDAFADAFSGLYIAEELQGVPMRDVTPQDPADVVVNPLGGDDEPMVNIKVADPDGNPMEEEGYEHPEPHDAEAPTEAVRAPEAEKPPKQRAAKKNTPAGPAGAGQAIHPDTIKDPPATAAARWAFEQYKFHVTQWVDLAVEGAGKIDGFLAETYIKNRYEKEKTLRNRLGVVLTAEQKAEILEFCREAVNIIRGEAHEAP